MFHIYILMNVFWILPKWMTSIRDFPSPFVKSCQTSTLQANAIMLPWHVWCKKQSVVSAQGFRGLLPFPLVAAMSHLICVPWYLDPDGFHLVDYLNRIWKSPICVRWIHRLVNTPKDHSRLSKSKGIRWARLIDPQLRWRFRWWSKIQREFGVSNNLFPCCLSVYSNNCPLVNIQFSSVQFLARRIAHIKSIADGKCCQSSTWTWSSPARRFKWDPWTWEITADEAWRLDAECSSDSHSVLFPVTVVVDWSQPWTHHFLLGLVDPCFHLAAKAIRPFRTGSLRRSSISSSYIVPGKICALGYQQLGW